MRRYGSSLQAQRTRAASSPWVVPAVHLCRRREHQCMKHCLLIDCGSSLQAQRTRVCRVCAINRNRFISAGAENTKYYTVPAAYSPVHLCRRREHVFGGSFKGHICGSSLQAQRTRISGTIPDLEKRFISAGAENTD